MQERELKLQPFILLWFLFPQPGKQEMITTFFSPDHYVIYARICFCFPIHPITADVPYLDLIILILGYTNLTPARHSSPPAEKLPAHLVSQPYYNLNSLSKMGEFLSGFSECLKSSRCSAEPWVCSYDGSLHLHNMCKNSHIPGGLNHAVSFPFWRGQNYISETSAILAFWATSCIMNLNVWYVLSCFTILKVRFLFFY